MSSISEEEYKANFGLGMNPDPKKAKRALEYAWDIRKFEIELYWKRSTHFWTLIGAIFAGYFVVLGSDKIENKNFYALIISCIGLVFSVAWHLANLGSKFWQENWEYQIEMLEDDFIGPLYKTTLSKNKDLSYSVTKINKITSYFTIVIWLALLINSGIKPHLAINKSNLSVISEVSFNKEAQIELSSKIINIKTIHNDQKVTPILECICACVFIIITATFIAKMLCHGKTTKSPKDSYDIIATTRKPQISPQERLNKF
ncbi:MAG: hypothetical protein HGB15_07110 [Chlorobaculum sp.]|nr:hypothetical protein [Chlorobaculum sp.]